MKGFTPDEESLATYSSLAVAIFDFYFHVCSYAFLTYVLIGPSLSISQLELFLYMSSTAF